MSSNGPCAVCGTETDYHQQEVNGETLTRCRKHSPKRGWKGALSDRVAAVLLPAALIVTPLVSAAHLFTDYTLFGDPNPYAPPILNWIMPIIATGFSVVMLVAIACLVVLLALEAVAGVGHEDDGDDDGVEQGLEHGYSAT